jgi:hypothetical protein
VARKKHNPGCPCCSSCNCFWSGEPTRSFVGTPTVKVVIAGVPDTISPVSVWATFSSLREYVPTGLSAINGTYFFPVSKQSNGCIIDSMSSGSPAAFATELIDYDSDLTTTTYDGSCYVTGSSTTSSTQQASIAIFKHSTFYAGGNPGDILIFLSAGESSAIQGVYYGLTAGLQLQCMNDYDYTAVSSSVENLVTIYPGYQPTWPRNSGDIKLSVGERAARCSLSAINYRFENAGTITAELLDL